MNFEDSDEQKLVRETTASFVKRHCKPADVRQWDRTGQLPEHVYAAMNNLLSILVSGIIIGVAETLGNVYLNGPLGFAVPYAVFIAILIFRPQGLFGSRSWRNGLR